MMNKIFICAALLVSALSASNNDYVVKDFSHLLGHVKGIDDALLKMHFKLYQGYVKNTNSLIATISDLGKEGKERTAAYGAFKRRFGWEYDGMRLHELYFENLGGDGTLSSKTKLYQQIVSDFGSFDAFVSDFKATGLIRGIGWVILYKDPIEGRLFNVWINEHDLGHLAGGEPLLVMDVWEHAYITQFGLDRAGYIDVFFKNVDWGKVTLRLH